MPRSVTVRGPRAAVAFLAASVVAACSGTAAPPASPAPSSAADACSASPAASLPAGWPSEGTGDVVPFLVSSELVVGENRFLFTLVDDQNRLLASEDVPVELAFFDLSRPADPTEQTEGGYLQTPDGRGLYRADVDFGCSGEWGAEITARMSDGPDRSARVVFSVQSDGTSPAIGEAVPPVETPTAETPDDIAAISTDTDPDPDFYDTSIAEALAAGEPFVVAFATPAFCQTRACGPALDTVKAVKQEVDAPITWIHVEPYQLELQDGQLQPVMASGEDGVPRMQTVEAVRTWGLRSEPFIYVVDAEGRVTGRFEGLAGEDELRDAIARAVA